MDIATRVLKLAQSEAPEFDFELAEIDLWPHEDASNRVTVFVSGPGVEIEVVVEDPNVSDDEIIAQIWIEIESRSAAAADIKAEKDSERH